MANLKISLCGEVIFFLKQHTHTGSPVCATYFGAATKSCESTLNLLSPSQFSAAQGGWKRRELRRSSRIIDFLDLQYSCVALSGSLSCHPIVWDTRPFRNQNHAPPIAFLEHPSALIRSLTDFCRNGPNLLFTWSDISQYSLSILSYRKILTIECLKKLFCRIASNVLKYIYIFLIKWFTKKIVINLYV